MSRQVGDSSNVSDFPRRWYANDPDKDHANVQSGNADTVDGGPADGSVPGGWPPPVPPCPVPPCWPPGPPPPGPIFGDDSRGRAWFFLPSYTSGGSGDGLGNIADEDGSTAPAADLAGYWTVDDHPIIPTPPAPPCVLPPCPIKPKPVPNPSLIYIEALTSPSSTTPPSEVSAEERLGGQQPSVEQTNERDETRDQRRVYLYSVLCLDGGDGESCNPLEPGFNGSKWHTANLTVVTPFTTKGSSVESELGANPPPPPHPPRTEVTIHYDSDNGEPHSTVHKGSTDPKRSGIAWADGSPIWLRSQCSCSCIPKDDPNCNRARCNGARMTSQLAEVAILDRPWVVFFHVRLPDAYSPQAAARVRVA